MNTWREPVKLYIFGFIPLPFIRVHGDDAPSARCTSESIIGEIRVQSNRFTQSMSGLMQHFLANLKSIPRVEQHRSGMSVGDADAIIIVDVNGFEIVIATDKITYIKFAGTGDGIDLADIHITGRDEPLRVSLIDNEGIAPMLGRRVFDFRRKELRGRHGVPHVGLRSNA